MHAIEESSAKTVFVCKIATFLSWKNDLEQKVFNIGVLGKSPTAKAMLALGEKKIGQKTVKFQSFDPASKNTTIDILFIAKDVSRPDQEIASLPEDHSIFIVGSSPDLIYQGGMMSVYIHHERLKFKVNFKNMVARGIGLRSQVLKLAEKVIAP